MIFTGLMGLRYLSVPMVTVLKNMNSMLTVAGDYLVYKRVVGVGEITCLGLIIIGAILSGKEDLEFNLTGYMWVGANCLATTSYVLSTRYLTSNLNMSKADTALYGQGVALLLLLPCVLASESHVLASPLLDVPSFQGILLLSGFVGIAINGASLNCIQATSPTTYAIVGSLNRIPAVLLGALFFHATISTPGWIFISLNLAGGVVYAASQSRVLDGRQSILFSASLLVGALVLVAAQTADAPNLYVSATKTLLRAVGKTL